MLGSPLAASAYMCLFFCPFSVLSVLFLSSFLIFSALMQILLKFSSVWICHNHYLVSSVPLQSVEEQRPSSVSKAGAQ